MSFFVDPEQLRAAMASITEAVLPRFLDLPHFRGYLVLQSDSGQRREMIVMSFWDDGLEDSRAASDAFVDAVYKAAGTNPTRKTYDILRAVVMDGSGDVRVDLP